MTEQVFTKRCTPKERKAFTPRIYWESHDGTQNGEPALGTLEQRLDIIRQRLSPGRNRIVLTNAERAELEQCRISE